MHCTVHLKGDRLHSALLQNTLGVYTLPSVKLGKYLHRSTTQNENFLSGGKTENPVGQLFFCVCTWRSIYLYGYTAYTSPHRGESRRQTPSYPDKEIKDIV